LLALEAEHDGLVHAVGERDRADGDAQHAQRIDRSDATVPVGIAEILRTTHLHADGFAQHRQRARRGQLLAVARVTAIRVDTAALRAAVAAAEIAVVALFDALVDEPVSATCELALGGTGLPVPGTGVIALLDAFANESVSAEREPAVGKTVVGVDGVAV